MATPVERRGVSLWRRTLPHILALLAGIGAYWIATLVADVRGLAIGVVVTFALIAAPVLGAYVGVLLARTEGISVVVRPYLRATAWMWGLVVVIAIAAATVESKGFIPNDTPAEGTIAFLIFVGVTLAFLWPWFVVPAAQIIHSVRRRAEDTESVT